jgi:hypothetical protein
MLVRSLLVLSTLVAGSASPPRPRTRGRRCQSHGRTDRVIERSAAPTPGQGPLPRFDFAVEREGKDVVRRSTPRTSGRRYRLEATTREAEPYVVLMNINTKAGRAWLKGAELHGEEAKKYLEQGHAIWVNDTYWLLMPYKMKDPGVILTLDGVEKKGADAWDKVLLTFDNVGLTPKDRYWAYVNRKTGLVERWDYVLKGEAKPPTTFTWRNWKRYGKVMLADDRQNPADGTRIYFPVLELPDSLADTVFIAP